MQWILNVVAIVSSSTKAQLLAQFWHFPGIFCVKLTCYCKNNIRNGISMCENPIKEVSHINVWKGCQKLNFQKGARRPSWIMLITRVAQGCHSGNQAKIVLGVDINTNQQKNFKGNNISRFVKWQIDYTEVHFINSDSMMCAPTIYLFWFVGDVCLCLRSQIVFPICIN